MPLTRRQFCRTASSLVAVGIGATSAAHAASTRAALGKVDRVEGKAHAVFGEGARALAAGAPIFVGDMITTGPAARIRFRMVDGAVITLGQNSSLTIDPVEKETGLPFLRFIRGALLAISGTINEQGRKGMTIKTPEAVLGVRGTTVWAGQEPGHLAVLMLEGAHVYVEAPEGSVVLAEGGLGTDVYADQPPTEPRRWPEKRVEASLAAVAFSDAR